MSSKLNERLQIAGNVGIIIGLLLVGVQLSQNSSLLKTQLLFEESGRLMMLETQYIGENAAEIWAKSIEDPAGLTLAEQRVMEALLWSVTEQWRATRMLVDLGLLEDNEWRPRVDADTEFMFGNRYAAAWWANFTSNGNASLPADLVDAINDGLATADPNFTPNHFRRLRDAINDDQGTADLDSE